MLRFELPAMAYLFLQERPSVDAILRLSYVKGHVERYAKHVMALSPLAPLGVEVPGVVPAASAPAAPALPPSDGSEETAQPTISATRSNSAGGKQPSAGVTPVTRTPVAARAPVRSSIGQSPGGGQVRAQAQQAVQSAPATPEAVPVRASSAVRKEVDTSDSGGGSPATPQPAAGKGGDRVSGR
jgi:NIMA (never in mitosis gene a)-related kinase